MNALSGGVHTAANAHDSKQRGAVWLWLLVVVQLAIPASYYLRGERDDERFAWRMFSAVRVQKCRVRAFAIPTEGKKQRLDLEALLHSAWVRSLERGRARVIERFLSEQCARTLAERAELVRSCEDASRESTTEQRFSRDCRSGKLTREAVR